MSSGTPPSEKCQTRYSTPAPELDDHRHQPSSLPRADHNSGTMAHRNTLRSGSFERPNLFQVNEALRDAGAGPISRDFENAIVDDDVYASRSIHEVEMPSGRRDSITPAVRRMTVRRSRNQQDRPNRSRESSPSSRSTSPPNSVEAFADPRRRERANTVGSRAPSELDLNRTISAVGTHHRRPTFSQGSILKPETAESRRDLAEEDVCFPPYEEPSKTYTIDYEELEEFVALCNRGRVDINGPCRRKHSLSCKAKPKLTALRQSNMNIPAIVTQDASPDRTPLQGSITEMTEIDEKLANFESGSSRQSENPNFYRYRFFSTDLQNTLHAADLGDLLAPGDSFRDLFELSPEGGAWWLDVLNASEDEVHSLCSAFSIHPLTSEDIRTQETREKVELFKQYYFVCFRTFDSLDKKSEDYMEPVNIYIVVFRQGVLSFSFSETPHAANVRKRIGKLRDYLALSSDWICYAMIDDIVDTFQPVIRDIEQETDVLEDQVFVARSDDFSHYLRQIGECRKKVMGLMRLLGGKADVIKGFAKRCNEQYSVTPRGEIGLYLGDIQDHVVTMMSNLGHFEKMLSRSHANYLAQLNVDSIAQGNHANKVLSKITLIATILVPLNLITGLFGMNVPVPGRDSDGLAWFFGILGVIGAFVVCSLLLARRLRYI